MLLAKGQKITFKYEEQPEDLLKDISFCINDKSRIGLIGNNGSGKSTLIKILRGVLKSKGHLETKNGLRIGYLSQQVSSGESCTVVDYLWRTRPYLYGLKTELEGLRQCSGVVDWSVVDDFEAAGGYNFENLMEKNCEQLQIPQSLLSRKIDTLSGGEKTKVGLLSTLIDEPDLLLFDEPTNHLDFNTLRWFREFLRSTSIPYIVVSHDRSILNDCALETWELKQGSLKVYSGNYQFYKEALEQIRTKQVELYERQQKKINQLDSAAIQRRVEANRMEKFKRKDPSKRMAVFAREMRAPVQQWLILQKK